VVVEILIYVFILATTPLVAHIDSFTNLGSVHSDSIEALLDRWCSSQFLACETPVGVKLAVAAESYQFSQGR
jgi:hypothetical protein